MIRLKNFDKSEHILFFMSVFISTNSLFRSWLDIWLVIPLLSTIKNTDPNPDFYGAARRFSWIMFLFVGPQNLLINGAQWC